MNKTVKNSAIYLCGTIIMGVIGFVNTMLLTRVLSTQVYAMYGLLTTFVSASIMFIDFGFDSAYTRFYYTHGFTQKKYMFMCIKYPLILFALVAIALIEPNHYFINYIFGNNLSPFAIIILLAYILIDVLHRFGQLTARMEEYALNYILSGFLSRIGFILVIVLVFFIKKDVSFNWVLISFAVSCTAALIMNLIVFAKVANNTSDSSTKVTTKELFHYGWPYMINNVFILIIPLVEKLIIRDLTDWTTLSIFTAASIFQTVVMLLTNTLSNIWNPIVYKHCDNEKVFKPILHNFGLAGTIIMSLGVAVCILLRRWLVLLLDANYFEVYIIAPSVICGACYQILNIIYSVGINIKKKTFHFIISPSIQGSISLILCFTLIPSMGLKGIAIASLASLVISKTYRIFVGLHYYNSGGFEWKTISICMICIASSIFTMYSTSFISDVLVCVTILTSMVIITNQELIPLCKTILQLVKPKRK